MVTEQNDERLSPNAISHCLPCIGVGTVGDANTGSTIMTESPQNQTQAPMENHSSHIEDHDTRLSPSAVQVWSAPIPGAGGFTVGDFCNFSKDPRLMRRGTE
jgi:hypothetical protein